MRVAEMIGEENGRAIEAALRRFVPMLESGGKEGEALSAEEWEWLAAVSDLFVWFNGTEYERLMYFRSVREYKHDKIAAALCVDRLTVFKLFRDVQICAAFRATARGLIAISPPWDIA